MTEPVTSNLTFLQVWDWMMRLGKVPDTILIYSKAEALYTKIVERARTKKQLEMKQNGCIRKEEEG